MIIIRDVTAHHYQFCLVSTMRFDEADFQAETNASNSQLVKRQLTVNSSHGELVTCDEFTFSPKSELVTVNSSQRLSQGKVNSPHDT